jgi:hypothetical protein
MRLQNGKCLCFKNSLVRYELVLERFANKLVGPLLLMQNTRQVHQVRSFGGGHLACLLARLFVRKQSHQ